MVVKLLILMAIFGVAFIIGLVGAYLLKHNEILENRWIPCGERMPETRCDVLICTSTGYVHIGWWYEADKFKDMNNVQYEDVVAWQPLPKPYKTVS